MQIVMFIRIILAILIVSLVLLWYKLNKTISIDRRVSRYSIDAIVDDSSNLEDAIKNRYNYFVSRFRRMIRGVGIFSKQADKYNKYILIGDKTEVIDFIVNKLLLGIIFVVLVIVSLSLQGKMISIVGMVISFIVGYYIYDIYLYVYNKIRIRMIKNDILRAVILLNNAFKAGKSIMQAVDIASNELPWPINMEFRKIYQDLSFGISSDVAFGRFAKRVNLEEARYISSSLTILNKTGGNIVGVFSSIEKTLFDKKSLEEDLKNSTQASNFIVKILMFIPFAFLLVIYVLSPNYFDPLLESSLGIMIIIVLVVMFSIYLYLLNKIMKVKV